MTEKIEKQKKAGLLVILGMLCIAVFFTAASPSRHLGGHRLDASSEEAITESFEKMKDSLSRRDQARLAEALSVILFSSLDEKGFAAAEMMPEKYLVSSFRKYHGKRAGEIIVAAEKIREKRQREHKRTR